MGGATRKSMLLTVMVVVLMWPAEQTVHTWFRGLLAKNPEGSVLNAVGQVGVAVTP
jgi:hypothetical protein